MIEENKYFIFDSPKNKYKYAIQNILYWINSFRYAINFILYKPDKAETKKNYVSICAIFKNEAKYLKEWIEYHRVIGIDHFYLYNNFSDDNFQGVLDPYITAGLVTLVDWPIKQGQMSAYKDCVDKYSKDTRWIAYLDLDEFIVPNRFDNINDALKKFEHRPIVIAYWRLFASSGIIKRNEKGLVIEDFNLCWRKYTNIGKYFYNTTYDYADDMEMNKNMHSRWSKCKGHKLPPVNFYGHIICNNVNIADDNYPPVQINHYFTKSYEEYLQKKARGDAFFELNPRDEEYFYWHDMKCQSTDYNIRKYMIKLKKAMGVE